MPVLVHGHLATVMTAAVFLLKTFISLPTYYYYYFHVLLSCIASPPPFFDFRAVSGWLLFVVHMNETW
jgi:hypothetical protein